LKIFMERVLELTAINLWGEIKSDPDAVDTGFMLGSVEPPRRIGDMTWGIRIAANYWRAVQFGVPDRVWVEPKNKKALRFSGKDGNIYFSKGHWLPPRPANPFVTRGAERATADDRMKAVIDTAKGVFKQ